MQEASKLARQSTGDFIAVAMTMRPQGATQREIINALGKPHRNKIKQLLQTKRVKRLILPDGSRSTRIKLVTR
jgi:SOS-response transcriptional repressor LexA